MSSQAILPYSPGFLWNYPLSTRRSSQSSCELCFDFEWQQVIGHNQPKFQGLKALSANVSQRARQRERTPILLLTNKSNVLFADLTTESAYVAIVNVLSFLECVKEHDRSARFFLNAKHDEPVMLPSTPISPRAQELIKALEAGVEGQAEIFIEALNSAGSHLVESLLAATIKSIERTSSHKDLESLANALATSSAGVVADAAHVARRRLAITRFESLLEADATEHEFQRWFQSNAWVLGSECIRILDGRRIDVNNIADLLIEAYDGHADIVELKRPRQAFWKTETDHDNYIPHQDLVMAIIQSQKYQFDLEGEIDSRKTHRRLSIPIAKPSSLLVYGRSRSWNAEQFEAQRLLNAGFANLRIVTYDQVLRRANAIMGYQAGADAVTTEVAPGTNDNAKPDRPPTEVRARVARGTDPIDKPQDARCEPTAVAAPVARDISMDHTSQH